jgi:hypothetical protein
MPLAQKELDVAKRRLASSKLEGRTYSGSIEIKDPWVYFDTAVLAALAGTLTLFSSVATVARSLTNYPYKELPQGQAFDIHALRVAYYGHALMADVTQQLLMDWINKAVLTIQIQNKVPIYERNLGSLIGGQVQVVTAPAVTVNSKNLTSWTASTVVRFKRKIELDQKTQWLVNIIQDAAANAALTGDYLRVEAIGRLTAQL